MTNNISGGVLYVVATPIGNLQDITLRALEILKNAEVIFAEDTRVTGKLLAQLSIKSEQKIISCHDFNEEARVELVKEFLTENKIVALVSDAGTPLISDPGYKIVNSLRKADFNIMPIPGVSAVITALSVAGLPSDSFLFRGFISAKKTRRQEQIQELKSANSTVVLYESVHRITYLLDDLAELVPDMNIVVAKEITKQFERFVSGTATEVKAFFDENSDIVRGEFVVLLDCNSQQEDTNNMGIDIDELLLELLEEMPLKKAVKLVVKLTKAKKNEVYEKALEFKKDL